MGICQIKFRMTIATPELRRECIAVVALIRFKHQTHAKLKSAQKSSWNFCLSKAFISIQSFVKSRLQLKLWRPLLLDQTRAHYQSFSNFPTVHWLLKAVKTAYFYILFMQIGYKTLRGVVFDKYEIASGDVKRNSRRNLKYIQIFISTNIQ